MIPDLTPEEKQEKAKIVKKAIIVKNEDLEEEKRKEKLLKVKHEEEAVKRHKQIKQIKKDMMQKPKEAPLVSMIKKSNELFKKEEKK